MKSRSFSDTGRRVSEIGLGCWQLGGSDWGDVSDEKALQILHAAADAGVTFFDAADVYGAGRSEELIARFLTERRHDDCFVATKLGRTSELYPDKYSEQGVREAVNASLKRLGVECIDLVQLHCVPSKTLVEGDIFQWLCKLKDEGKIRSWGASVESVSEAETCLAHDGIQSLQVIFNVFRQKPSHALFERCLNQGVAIIVRLPLASGLLAGKMSLKSHFAPNDHRHFNRNGECFNVGETFAGLPFEKGLELIELLRPHVPMGWSMADFAQRWILDFPAVTTVITGASSPEQVRANALVSDLPSLPAEIHQTLRRYHDLEVAPFIRGPY